MTDMGDIARSSDFGGIEIFEPVEPQVVGHDERVEDALSVSGTEIGVDVADSEAGVSERALCDLGMQLRRRLVRGVTCRMFVDAGDISFTLDGHLAPASSVPTPCRYRHAILGFRRRAPVQARDLKSHMGAISGRGLSIVRQTPK
jgi:hypothetical protein